ncbi:MAG: hypothetical protein ACRENP_15510 [Longimicrobiales bacterium]
MDTGATFAVVARDTIARGNFDFNSGHAEYDVTADGKHVLLIGLRAADAATIVVHNWREELRQRRAAARR